MGNLDDISVEGLRKCAWHERARACGAWHAQANVRAVRAGLVRVRFMCVSACVVRAIHLGTRTVC